MSKGSNRRPTCISRKMERLNDLYAAHKITFEEFKKRRQELIDSNEYFKKGWR